MVNNCVSVYACVCMHFLPCFLIMKMRIVKLLRYMGTGKDLTRVRMIE